MLISRIKSRPVYGRAMPDYRGARHLLICDRSVRLDNTQTAEFEQLAETLTIISKGNVTVGPFKNLPCRNIHEFEDDRDLLTTITSILRSASISQRLYVIGTEPFLADVRRVATECGLSDDAVQYQHFGSMCRRVYCIHCRTIAESVTTNIVGCGACGAELLVRDHYSRRLSAFMGVMCDAEAPGTLPARSEDFL
jgi:hypothetical protein